MTRHGPKCWRNTGTDGGGKLGRSRARDDHYSPNSDAGEKKKKQSSAVESFTYQGEEPKISLYLDPSKAIFWGEEGGDPLPQKVCEKDKSHPNVGAKPWLWAAGEGRTLPGEQKETRVERPVSTKCAYLAEKERAHPSRAAGDSRRSIGEKGKGR